MASKYWIKLYHEILDDPKMGKLQDHLWRRAIELFLIAGESEDAGRLPKLADLAWRLRVSEDDVTQDLEALAIYDVEIVNQQEDGWYVTKFADRQAAVPSEERGRRFRDRERKENYNQTPDEREPNETFVDKKRIDTDEKRIEETRSTNSRDNPKPKKTYLTPERKDHDV